MPLQLSLLSIARSQHRASSKTTRRFSPDISAIGLYCVVAIDRNVGATVDAGQNPGDTATAANNGPPHSVKTRIQLDPAKYNRGMIGGFKQVIQTEGAGALMTGFGPTAAGYFLQGAFKFGGYELFKQQSINLLGYENAVQNRTMVYIASAAVAEFFADVALCPLEATRIRLVSQPTYANGLLGGFSKMMSQEGIGAFYAGFGPILFKQ